MQGRLFAPGLPNRLRHANDSVTGIRNSWTIDRSPPLILIRPLSSSQPLQRSKTSLKARLEALSYVNPEKIERITRKLDRAIREAERKLQGAKRQKGTIASRKVKQVARLKADVEYAVVRKRSCETLFRTQVPSVHAEATAFKRYAGDLSQSLLEKLVAKQKTVIPKVLAPIGEVTVLDRLFRILSAIGVLIVDGIWISAYQIVAWFARRKERKDKQEGA